MKQYEDKERVQVTKRECVKLCCDMCGRIAEYPKSETWEFGGVGTARGSLDFYFSIDGEYEPEEIDLCYDCADWIADLIRRGRLKRATRGSPACAAGEESGGQIREQKDRSVARDEKLS